jgi:uncharacterized protein (TIGR02266 family)
MANDVLLKWGAQGERALEELGSKLAAVPDDAVVRPHTDPYAAAVTALLVSDWLRQPAVAARLPVGGVGPDDAETLRNMALALVVLVGRLGGEYLPDGKGIPGDLVQRGHTVRTSTIAQIEKALPENREVKLWLDAVRLGNGVVDLVYDLRTLADVHSRHRDALPDSLAKLPGMLRAASDAIEYALRSDEPKELAATRHTIARLWPLFVPEYERAAAAGRAITRDEGSERSFPTLALVAAHRRAKRNKPISLIPPKNVELEAPPSSASESRRMRRAVLELEVGISSESNFWVGITENISVSGVFVATYAMRPLGSKLVIGIKLPDGQTMHLPGVVRWQRAASPDGWPGIGVEFDNVSPEQEKRIRKFLSLREPMFYDD